MSQFETFLQMGGYAAYVWPALGLTVAILVGMAATSIGRLRASERALKDAEARFGRGRRDPGTD
jgi:heme exporter protein CcmD